MENVTGLKCTVCGKVYKQGEVEYVCSVNHPTCGNLDVEYDYTRVNSFIKSDEEGSSVGSTMNNTTWPTWTGMWRYRRFLPLSDKDSDNYSLVSSLSVGNTPLVPAPVIASLIGASEVWIKDEGRNPSASLKDRASALVALKCKLEGRGVVSTASTGNAAAALSGVCASLKQPCVIFVPASAPEAKRTQLLVYGANVVLVNGKYDDAFDMCLEACKKYGWYCRNTGYNPFTVEGKKTVSYELCEQLFRRHNPQTPEHLMKFEAPDVIAVSVGDGNIISGVHKGLKDLFEAGRINKMPKLLCIQAETSASIADAWEKKFDMRKEALPVIDAVTVADSISADLPRDPIRALEAATLTGGAYIKVSDAEIIAALPEFARMSGVFAEPAGSATFAGLKKAATAGLIPAGSRVVVISTGNGLKDIASAIKSVANTPYLRVEKGALSQTTDALAAALNK